MDNNDILIQIRSRLLSDIRFYKEALQSVVYELQQLQRTIYGQSFYPIGTVPPNERVKYLNELKSTLRAEIGTSITALKKLDEIENARMMSSQKGFEQFKNEQRNRYYKK